MSWPRTGPPEQHVFEWRPVSKRSELILDLWVLWLVLYSIPIMVRGGGYILAAPQLATAVTCILLCFALTHRPPVSRKRAIRDSIVAGVFVTLLALPVRIFPCAFHLSRGSFSRCAIPSVASPAPSSAQFVCAAA